MKINCMNKRFFMLFMIFFAMNMILFNACSNEDNSLAPYMGLPEMSTVKVEQGTFRPKITWVGGYTSVIGVNVGSRAALDSSLIYLIKINGNNLHFPITYGVIPDGAINLIDVYGGQSLDSLNEDNLYTYWVMKEDAWDKVSNITGKRFLSSNSLSAGEVKSDSDSLVEISSYSFAVNSQFIDVFVNIKDIKFFGKLGKVSVIQPVDSHPPIIKWQITQLGVSDTAISALGVVEGQQFDEKYIVWDLWSDEETDSGKVLGKKNIITSPLYMGSTLPNTASFHEYPVEGLGRDKDYYIWIATKEWNGIRSRVVNYYAYATFRTW